MQEARQLREKTAGGAAAADAVGAAAGRHQLDIENLSFHEGSHLMSNKECNLPKNSYRSAFKVACSCQTRLPQISWKSLSLQLSGYASILYLAELSEEECCSPCAYKLIEHYDKSMCYADVEFYYQALFCAS